MEEQFQQPQNWLRRNVKWIIPAGVLGAVVFCASLVILILVIVFGAIRSSDVYQMALEKAQQSPAVIRALGEPIEAGFFSSGSLETSGSSGSANLKIPLTGRRDTGTLHVIATKRGGEWSFSQLVVEVKSTGERINLLRGQE